jgi:hypothetical protein
MRVKIMMGYHWACALYCRRTKKVIVVNRDQGLDIAFNKSLEEAHKITKNYLGGYNFEEKRGLQMKDLFITLLNLPKSLTYLPRFMIKGVRSVR